MSKRWESARQVGRKACAECHANPEEQVLEGHDDCLPVINGHYTADGVKVEVGLRVWDYDLRSGTVIEVARSLDGTPDGPLGIVAWHEIKRDDGGTVSQDGSRLCTRHPFTGASPSPAKF